MSYFVISIMSDDDVCSQDDTQFQALHMIGNSYASFIVKHDISPN